MKNYKLLLLAAVFVVTSSASCKKGGVSSNFDKSYDAWQAYQKKVNNTYAYTAITDDHISEATSTKITVTNGDITARDFYLYQYKSTPDSTGKFLSEEWHETATGHTLSTHGSEGAGLFTLDDIYYKAQNIWLKANQSTNVITFETNNNGMISVAGYTPKNCKTNDCFIGINIQSITP